MLPTDVAIRPFSARADYDACVRLQREVWGEHFVDVASATILMVSQRVGGVSAGAFDPDGRLLGFVFGISGIRDGELVHWSDMLAVRPEARGAGLEKRLKGFQRDQLLSRTSRRVRANALVRNSPPDAQASANRTGRTRRSSTSTESSVRRRGRMDAVLSPRCDSRARQSPSSSGWSARRIGFIGGR